MDSWLRVYSARLSWRRVAVSVLSVPYKITGGRFGILVPPQIGIIYRRRDRAVGILALTRLVLPPGDRPVPGSRWGGHWLPARSRKPRG